MCFSRKLSIWTFWILPGVAPGAKASAKAKSKAKAKAKAKSSPQPNVAEVEPKTLDDLKSEMSGKLNISICETCQLWIYFLCLELRICCLLHRDMFTIEVRPWRKKWRPWTIWCSTCRRMLWGVRWMATKPDLKMSSWSFLFQQKSANNIFLTWFILRFTILFLVICFISGWKRSTPLTIATIWKRKLIRRCNLPMMNNLCFCWFACLLDSISSYFVSFPHEPSRWNPWGLSRPRPERWWVKSASRPRPRLCTGHLLWWLIMKLILSKGFIHTWVPGTDACISCFIWKPISVKTFLWTLELYQGFPQFEIVKSFQAQPKVAMYDWGVLPIENLALKMPNSKLK